jgi:type IV pilus assembly protein PilY1
MQNVKSSFLLRFFCGLFFIFYACAPVYAFTPSQQPLLSASTVSPNLMLFVDNSGSMNHLIRAADYDATVNYGTVYDVNYACNRNFCGYYQGDLISAENTTISGLGSTGCFSGYDGFWWKGAVYCLAFPTPAGNSTLIAANYIAYLLNKAGTTKTVNYVDRSTNPVIPQGTRMSVAISVTNGIIDDNPSIRMGLTTLNVSNNKYIVAPVADISTTAGATTLKNYVSALVASGGTPLAQAYYEITRYFRGLKPYSWSSNTSYTSPIQYRCQKNYSVVVTDGLPSVDRNFPTQTSQDADAAGKLPNWDGINNDGPNTGSNADGDTLYLDDLVKFGYDIDMQTPSNTPSLDLAGKNWDTDGFTKQNLSAYTVGFTVSNQMMIDAAAYGHGIYYQANDSDGLTTALQGALSDINSKAGSGGAGAANSSTLQTGATFYQTLYDPTDWHGTIKAYTLDSTGAFDATKPIWNTDKQVVSSTTSTTVFESRNTDTTGKTITLDYPKFSATQRAVLDAGLPSGLTGANLVAWVKGGTVAGLRSRTLLLGDIINSPLVAAVPSDQTASDLLGDTSYTTYLAKKVASMNYNLLVNANDGFMDVINPTDGTRRYAYMPSTVLPSLSTIAGTGYNTGTHKFTVDGQISVFDTQLTAGGTWQTLALGGTGAGGKAYYAVQLFESGGSNTISALWEIKAPDTSTPTNAYNNLGYAYSKPAVARLADGTGVMIIGNGYGSFGKTASLFVINIATGAVIKEIAVPVGTGESDNGLSSVRLRVNASNVVQAAYAGDLYGHLWKFDLSSTATSGWGVAFGGKPLFTAPRGAAQPITVQPLLLDHPNGGKIVYFGTGKFSEIADKTTTALQDFYAIWDSGSSAGNFTESTLQPQAVAATVSSNGDQYFTTTSNTVDWTSKNGWYLPLASSGTYLGERIIYPAQTSRGRIIFTTAAVSATDPCASTGIGRLFELDAATGSMLTYAVLDTSGDGVVDDASDIKVSGMAFGGGIPNLASIVSGTGTAADSKYVIDSSAKVTILKEKGGTTGLYQRIMWRQIQ